MRPPASSAAALTCPGCGASYPQTERFCPACGLPLVRGGSREVEASERHRRARKIKPQLSEGPPVRVAGARNLAEAEFIQGLLLEEGVPSMLRRSPGADVPDFLAAGPRDVLVPLAARETAREILLQAEVIRDQAPPRPIPARRLLAVLLAALGLAALLVWLITLATR